jgi:hypothetical protein
MSLVTASLQVSPVTGDVTPYYIAMQPVTQGSTTREYVSTTCTFIPSTGVLNATATSARYADLAEVFIPDKYYEPGTVVVFGGSVEITITDIGHDTRVAGVVSTSPAYLMNSESTGVPVAMTGRVPCQVKGPVTKGTVLVTSATPGVAEAIDYDLYRPGAVLGKSLGEIPDSTIQTIEVVVGRF